MTTFLTVIGSVTPPGRLHAAVAGAVEMAAAPPDVSASLLDLAEHRISFADGRPLDCFDAWATRTPGSWPAQSTAARLPVP